MSSGLSCGVSNRCPPWWPPECHLGCPTGCPLVWCSLWGFYQGGIRGVLQGPLMSSRLSSGVSTWVSAGVSSRCLPCSPAGCLRGVLQILGCPSGCPACCPLEWRNWPKNYLIILNQWHFLGRGFAVLPVQTGDNLLLSPPGVCRYFRKGGK